ncbi:MAG: hypothetical protein QOJ99_2479 [Bryobacterales bacterium]|jgi:hypothetical protein|nr:hypothetical protein [Bryobacterales bacterium]
MLCVATMGIHFAQAGQGKELSSPVGPLSPAVANGWCLPQRKTGRNAGRDFVPSPVFYMNLLTLCVSR